MHGIRKALFSFSRLHGRVLAGIVSSALACAFLTISCWAQEIHFLGINGSGSSSVAISGDQEAAFITDGGRAGKAGIAGAALDGKPVIDYLTGLHVTHLVVACSHPHSDHLAGLIELVTKPRELSERFDSVVFVESGFKSGSKGGSLSLIEHYNKAIKNLPSPMRRGIIVPNQISGNSSPLVYRYGPKGGIEVKYFGTSNGSSEKQGPHGLALITQYYISNSKGATILVDFDDASSARTAAWIKEHGKELIGPGHKALAVIPHHGSDAEKIDAILASQFDGCIISVDPLNEYGHPGPKNLLKIVSRFGRENVFFTGAEGNIVVSAGNMPSPHKNFASIFNSFILPQRQYNELTVRKKEASLLAALKESNKKAAKRMESDMTAAVESVKATYALESIYVGQTAAAPSVEWEIPHRSALDQNIGQNTGTWADLEEVVRKRMIHRNHGSETEKKPTDLYTENEKFLPTAGGVIAGGIVVSSPIKPLSATWHMGESNGTTTVEEDTELLIQTDQGAYRYDTATYTEFCLAQKLVEQNDVTLVSGNYDKDQRHYFDVNPAIANTLVAWYAMQLDMFMEQEGTFKIASSLDFKMPEWKKLVWLDRRSRIQLRGDRIEVVANDDGSDMLYQVLIKTYSIPDWWTEYLKDQQKYIAKIDAEYARIQGEAGSLERDLLLMRTKIELTPEPSRSRDGTSIYDLNDTDALRRYLNRDRRVPGDQASRRALITQYNRKAQELRSLEARLNEIHRKHHEELVERFTTHTWDSATTQTASDALNRKIQLVAREFVGLRRVNDFAKTVHVLRWLRSSGIILPPLPQEKATFINANNDLSKDDYLPQNILNLRGRAKSGGMSLDEAIAAIPVPHEFNWFWIIIPSACFSLVVVLVRVRKHRHHAVTESVP